MLRRRLLARDEERAVMEAIGRAERKTSAEIRVVVERRCPGGDPYARAVQRFEELGMTRTKQRNGVLIYVALRDRKFAIIGDEGIHRHVGDEFWQEVRDAMQQAFRERGVVAGIVAGVERAGEALARYFPPSEDDVNELPDEIAY